MDAVEYLKTIKRMCKLHKPMCWGEDNHTPCELRIKANAKGMGCGDYAATFSEEAVEIVEKWSKEHPLKTRQSELLKMFPRAEQGEDGLVVFCPENFDSKIECPSKKGGGYGQCGECRKNYWLEEVE